MDQIDLVQKYVGSEGKEPKIYKLGGSDWKKVKKKVQSAVQDIADDLIKLYAEREAAKVMPSLLTVICKESLKLLCLSGNGRSAPIHS